MLTLGTLQSVWTHPGNSGRRARQTALYMWVRTMNHLGRDVVVPAGGHSRLMARHDASSAAAVVRSPVADWRDLQAWKQLLKPGDLFIDIGAHLGVYTIWAIEQGAEVVAFEPHPLTAEMLRQNLELNGYHAQVHEVALAHEPGRMRLAGADLARQALSANGEIEIDVRTLDEFATSAAGVKIDVEGAERLVLEGATALLDRGRPVLQLEWNKRSVDTLGEDRAPVAALLAGKGYCFCRPDSAGSLLPVDDLDFGADLWAVPTERPR
jgi:FkbM family methyltransferase